MAILASNAAKTGFTRIDSLWVNDVMFKSNIIVLSLKQLISTED